MAQLGLTERELHAWRTSFRMVELLRTRIEQQLQASSGLSNADYTVLALLAEAPDRRMRAYELGRVAGWEKSRMHHQLTRMERRGLVVRERCGSRGIDAVLTAEGLAALRKAVPGHAEEVRRLFIDRLTPEELERFADIAAKILDNLQAAQPPAIT
ncbi:MarR family winged helix-turn-helix transcriptional regulator [Sphaerimonospora thailandensis]|uniref:MarR family transcriptional regulator n=1 Tax=Sphaerimonospora thailandensis TaxID=795644 RepID=A0A8J3RDN0_9ACTN|nr:MarR family transcriptional regulator [Sphaerimonospora thailandensis]GIH72835.1 MarR family transcriptional regulator [Sphaerimonospora thailandensis]